MSKEAKCPLDADILVGGQAVLEGVMMRTPNAFAVVVRKPDGEMVVMKERAARWTDRFPILKWPILRGPAILIQSLVLGIRTLNYSAEVAMEAEEAQAGHPEPDQKQPPAPEKAAATGKKKNWMLAGTMVFSLAAGVAIFILVPYWLSALATAAVYPGQDSVHEHWVFFNLVDGVIRVIFFLAYILLISLMKDIRRVFQYHGAEHKVVHLWESKAPLTVENARPFTTLHPRCGTSFLLFVMVVSIIVFTVFKFDWWVLKVLSRVFLLPLIAGISYELIRLSAKFPRNPFLRAIMTPGLALQRITTRPPSDDMLEVSLRALQEALAVEAEIKQEQPAPVPA